MSSDQFEAQHPSMPAKYLFFTTYGALGSLFGGRVGVLYPPQSKNEPGAFKW